MIWRGGRLKGPVLSLVGGVRRVGRRQVGVVPSCWSGCHCCCHGDAKGAVGDGVVRGGVGKCGRCGRVMDTWVGEAGIRQGGEGGERSFYAHPGVTEGCEVRTCERVKVGGYNLLILLSVFNVCACSCVVPVSREDRSLSDARPGESGLAVWTVGVVIWPR